MDMVWFSKGSRGSWISGFLVFQFKVLNQLKTKQKQKDKAITRISNFSVARECKDPEDLENNSKERGQEKEEKREGGPGPLGAPGPPPSSLHSLATEKFKIRVMALCLDFFVLFEVGSNCKPEKPQNQKSSFL